MKTFEVITYGGADVLQTVFNAVAITLGSGEYSALLRIGIIFGATWALFLSMVSRSYFLSFKWLLTYYVVLNIVLVPIARIQVIDRLPPHTQYTVDHVPLGLGFLAHLTSVIGDSTTRMLDRNFSLPEDLKYSQTGMGMASQLMLASQTLHFPDAQFEKNLKHFMQQCVFYDVFYKKYSFQTLSEQTDLWGFMLANASPARGFEYAPEGIVSCKTGAEKLNAAWATVTHTATTHLNTAFFNATQANSQKLLAYLPQSYTYLMQWSATAAEGLRQALLIQALQASAGQAPLNSTLAFERAQAHKRLTHDTLGRMAAHWLPLMKNLFEGFFYGVFLLIAPLGLLPIGFAILKNYCVSLFWIQMWAPLYAILNLYMTVYAQHKTLGVLGHSKGLTLENSAQVNQIQADIGSLAGYIALSIPFIATGLVRGMAGTFTAASHYLGGAVQGTALSAAHDVSAGNVEMGNTTFEMHHAYSSQTHTYENDLAFNQGRHGYQTSGGGYTTISASGDASIDVNHTPSNLPVDASLHNAVLHQLSDRAETYRSLAENYETKSEAAYTQAIEESTQVSSGETVMENWVSNYLAGETQRDYASEISNQESEAVTRKEARAGTRTGLKGEGSVGGKLFGIGGTLSGSIESETTRSITKEQADTTRDISEHTSQQEMSHHTESGVSLSVGNESVKSDAVKHALENSYSHAETAAQYATQANVFQAAVEHMQQSGVDYSVSLNQGLYEWLIHDKGYSHGDIEALGRDPVKAASLAKAYVDQLETIKI